MADWIIPGHGGTYKNNRVGESVETKEKKSQAEKGPKISVACKRCGKEMRQKDKCFCRPYLCFNCCECGLDCDLCYCSHQRNK